MRNFLKSNYMLTVGDKEVENKTVALRTRDNVVHGEVDISDFLAKVVNERDDKSIDVTIFRSHL